MVAVNCDGLLPEPYEDLPGLPELLAKAERLPNAAYEHIGHYRIGHAIDEAMAVVRATNKFFNDTAPWILAREGKTKELGGVLYACCELIRIVSIVLFPVMPGKMREIRAVLSEGDATLTLDNARTFFHLKPGTEIHLDQPVFPRFNVPKEKAAKKPAAKDEAVTEEGLLDISDFVKVQLRVAEVLEAERVEGADKLLKLQIDLGKEKRQIVAGIAKHYEPEQIKGKKVVVVANLKPATIRGVESNGMLLAAKSGKKLYVVTPDGDLPAGAKLS